MLLWGLKMYMDASDAKETNRNAKRTYRRAKEALDAQMGASSFALESLGKKKEQVFGTSMKSFVTVFEQLKNVELTESVGMDELANFRIDAQKVPQFRKLADLTPSIVGISVAGLISPLFAGIMGFAVSKKASAQYDTARANYAQAQKLKTELEAAGVACNAIRRRAYMFYRLLVCLDSLFLPLIVGMENAIAAHGTDFRAFSDDEKHTVAAAVSIAGAIKAVLDTPILTEDGKLTDESAAVAEDISARIAN